MFLALQHPKASWSFCIEINIKLLSSYNDFCIGYVHVHIVNLREAAQSGVYTMQTRIYINQVEQRTLFKVLIKHQVVFSQ